MASHIGIAKPRFIESCVVGVKVYGSSPSRFMRIKNRSREIRVIVHFCPL